MKKLAPIRTAFAAALLTAAFVSVPAAGPFQVRRATTAAGVLSAPPVATIATAPYDGEPIPAGGLNYYYGVYDGSGNPLAISMAAIAATQTVRIGFDDGNPTSAPVAALASTVTVAPATIQANGIETAGITITPRDANGVLLGRGLTIAIDPAVLWPAQLSGSVTDLGTGIYTATAVSSVAGIATVRVLVEGVSLATMPTITVTPIDPAGSLRDLAVQQLGSLTGAGGPLAGLAAEAGSGTTQNASITTAIGEANNALSYLVNNPSQDDSTLKSRLNAAVVDLMNVQSQPGTVDPVDLRDALDDLMGVARLVALWHIQQAETVCGACDGSGNPPKVCGADTELATADALRAATNPQWTSIVDHYASAVTLALKAVSSC